MVNLKFINTYLKNVINFLNTQNWLIVISLLILIPALLTYFLGLINDKLSIKYTTRDSFVSKMFKVIWLPILLFLWVISIFIALKIGFPELPIMENKLFNNIPLIITLVSFSSFLYILLSLFEDFLIYNKNYNNEYKNNKIPFRIFLKILKIVLISATALLILQNLGVDILTLILFSGSYLSVIGGLVIINSIIKIIYHKIISAVIKNSHFWIYILTKSLYQPLQSLLILGSTYLCYKIAIIKWEATQTISDLIFKIYSLTLLGLLAWFFLRFAKMFEEQLLLGRLTKKTPGKTTAQASAKLIKVVMLVILVLASLPVIGFPIQGILAFSGGSAIVVGIAVRPILSYYFSGLLIYSDRFFEVGDWIHSHDKNIEGTVEEIGWRSTRIRTFDKRPLYVPNSVFSEISVINASRMSNRRIKETFGIRFSDYQCLDIITKEIRTMLREHPEIDTTQTLLVHFTDFSEYALNINVYTFTKTRDWKRYRDIQQDVFVQIINIIENNNAKLAFPSRFLQTKSISLNNDS